MAEERLIDDDKDKKYRFRINADGEEELIIDDGEKPAADGEEAELSFDHAPDIDEGYAYDAEEANHYEASEEQNVVQSLLEKARGEVEAERFSTALEYLAQAKEILPEDGEVAALELMIYTRRLTDFSQGVLGDAVAAARNVEKFSSQERRQELREEGAERLHGMISALQPQVEELDERNEKAKAGRAVRFSADNRKSVIICLALLAPFIIFGALAIYFSTVMFADTSGAFIWLTVIFGVLAALCFVAVLFAARRLSTTWRRVRMNRDNSRTQLGRDYEAAKSRLEALRTIYNVIAN